MRCRKNQASLTADERARFVAAVLALKADGRYDQYVADHGGAHLAAHRGPAFLPWHREYLRRLELDLASVDPQVTLPYWDWTTDNSAMSSLWGPDLLGGNGRPSDNRVMTGPFAFEAGNWTLVHGADSDLKRAFGQQVPTLPTAADVTAALAETPYDVAPYSMASASGFRNKLEGWISGPQLHNRVHVWVGGSMLPMTSPNDPAFFLHHCFVDKLWADWQAAHPDLGYLPVSGAASGHNLDDPMQPWQGQGDVVRPSGLLDHHALGYAYDTEQVCQPKPVFKIEKLETKETIKAEKVEKAELKERQPDKLPKAELKEAKLEKLEKPEVKERKGEVPEKHWREDLKHVREAPVERLDQVRDVSERIESLEQEVLGLEHFISEQLRPDLSRGALHHEPDQPQPPASEADKEQADKGLLHEH